MLEAVIIFFLFSYVTASLTGTNRFINYILPLLDWFGAQAYCRQFHTDLATATNSMDNNDIKSKVIFLTSSWFGLFRDTWTWLDGTIASNIPWGLFQPDNLFGAQNCGVFAVGLISDETCSSQYAFFCHSSESFFMAIYLIKMQCFNWKCNNFIMFLYFISPPLFL